MLDTGYNYSYICKLVKKEFFDKHPYKTLLVYFTIIKFMKN